MNKSIFIGLLSFFCCQFTLIGQDETTPMEKEMIIVKDSVMMEKKCCDMSEMKDKHIVSAEYRQYLNPAKGTVSELAQNGFILDEQAMEFALKFGNFPKLYYYQQLGTLSNSQYVSLYGIGLKEKYQRDFIKHPNILVAPYLEVGIGFYQLSVTRNVNSNSIQSALSGQIEENRIDNFSVTGDLGLQLGFSFGFLGSNVHISAVGGYQTNLPSNWKTGHSLAFREKLDLSSAYFGGKLSVTMPCCCKE